MPAPKGNEFWKLRSKHGRDKLFSDPQLLWEEACKYFQWCDNHPYYKVEQKKGNIIIPKSFDGDIPEEISNPIAKLPTERPYSLSGLCLFLDCDEKTFRSYGHEVGKEDFFPIVRAITAVIETQQFEGATIGIFNSNIIARKLGLVDKSDLTSDGQKLTFDIRVKKSDAES